MAKTTTKKTTKKSASAADKPPTKSELLSMIAERTELTKKDVSAVLDELGDIAAKNLSKRGPGAFTIPGLLKLTRKDIPRKAAQKNVWVPLLQEYRDIPAKPARTKINIRALKGLKDKVK